MSTLEWVKEETHSRYRMAFGIGWPTRERSTEDGTVMIGLGANIKKLGPIPKPVYGLMLYYVTSIVGKLVVLGLVMARGTMRELEISLYGLMAYDFFLSTAAVGILCCNVPWRVKMLTIVIAAINIAVMLLYAVSYVSRFFRVVP